MRAISSSGESRSLQDEQMKPGFDYAEKRSLLACQLSSHLNTTQILDQAAVRRLSVETDGDGGDMYVPQDNASHGTIFTVTPVMSDMDITIRAFELEHVAYAVPNDDADPGIGVDVYALKEEHETVDEGVFLHAADPEKWDWVGSSVLVASPETEVKKRNPKTEDIVHSAGTFLVPMTDINLSKISAPRTFYISLSRSVLKLHNTQSDATLNYDEREENPVGAENIKGTKGPNERQLAAFASDESIQDDLLRVHTGVGMSTATPFPSSVDHHRQFRGSIHYQREVSMSQCRTSSSITLTMGMSADAEDATPQKVLQRVRSGIEKMMRSNRQLRSLTGSQDLSLSSMDVTIQLTTSGQTDNGVKCEIYFRNDYCKVIEATMHFSHLATMTSNDLKFDLLKAISENDRNVNTEIIFIGDSIQKRTMDLVLTGVPKDWSNINSAQQRYMERITYEFLNSHSDVPVLKITDNEPTRRSLKLIQSQSRPTGIMQTKMDVHLLGNGTNDDELFGSIQETLRIHDERYRLALSREHLRPGEINSNVAAGHGTVFSQLFATIARVRSEGEKDGNDNARSNGDGQNDALVFFLYFIIAVCSAWLAYRIFMDCFLPCFVRKEKPLEVGSKEEKDSRGRSPTRRRMSDSSRGRQHSLSPETHRFSRSSRGRARSLSPGASHRFSTSSRASGSRNVQERSLASGRSRSSRSNSLNYYADIVERHESKTGAPVPAGERSSRRSSNSSQSTGRQRSSRGLSGDLSLPSAGSRRQLQICERAERRSSTNSGNSSSMLSPTRPPSDSNRKILPSPGKETLLSYNDEPEKPEKPSSSRRSSRSLKSPKPLQDTAEMTSPSSGRSSSRRLSDAKRNSFRGRDGALSSPRPSSGNEGRSTERRTPRKSRTSCDGPNRTPKRPSSSNAHVGPRDRVIMSPRAKMMASMDPLASPSASYPEKSNTKTGRSSVKESPRRIGNQTKSSSMRSFMPPPPFAIETKDPSFRTKRENPPRESRSNTRQSSLHSIV